MGEGSISRSMLVLGLLSAFIVLLYSGTGLQGPQVPFNPVFPTFQNPFDQQGSSSARPVFTLGTAHFTLSLPTHSSAPNRLCSDIKYYDCIEDRGQPDTDTTYIIMYPANVTIDNSLALVGMDIQGKDWTRFSAFKVTLICKWQIVPGNGVRSVNLGFEEAYSPTSFHDFGAGNNTSSCPASSWGEAVFVDSSFTGSPSDPNGFIQMFIDISIGPNNGQLFISTAIVELFFSVNTQCAGNGFFGDTACQIGRFFDPVIKGILFGLNILLYIGGWVIAAGQYLANMASIIVWLYAIPGMPVEIQLLLDAALTAMMGILLLKMAGLVRGIGVGI